MTSRARVFIDGEHGTTGLQIRQRLGARDQYEVLSIPLEARRDFGLRADMLNEADIAILCLPDEASREAVAMLDEAGNNATRLIDASTAHRTADDWVFGFAELSSDQGEAIAGARFVSNPGCYSTGAIALLRPLTDAGILANDYPVTINAVSGYTGGGKALIARMAGHDSAEEISSSFFHYALTLAHKHLPEIVKHARLTRIPVFTPSVGRFPQGMLVSVPLHADLLQGAPDVETLRGIFEQHYAGCAFVEVADAAMTNSLDRIEAEELTGVDGMRIYVFGNREGSQINLVSSLDNLGKGASGAAIQNLDLMTSGVAQRIQ
jgi:N-acetyl-gamma-glutamyl-phosphate reductase